MARPKKKAGRKGAEPADKLTLKQRQFVVAYLGAANGNATEAARIAGYSTPHPEGSRLLRNATIRSEIESRLAESAMSAAEVLARLSAIARADIGDYFTLDDAGRPVLNLAKARADGKLRLIQRLTPTKHGWSIGLHDAVAALEKLGKYHGLFGDRPLPPPTEDRPRLTIPDADDRPRS